MTLLVSHTTFDCHDAYALSEWWKPVLGYVDLDGDPNLPGHEECLIRDPETGPDDKTGKNRLHLDLASRDGRRDDEVERVLGLGATVLEDHRGIHGPGTGWVTLADPEGNEFCVVRSQAERDATPAVHP